MLMASEQQNQGRARAVWAHVCKKIVAGRGLLPGPESVFLSNTGKWIVQGDQARVFTGKGCLDGEQQGQGTQEDCSAKWLASCFCGNGVSFLVVSDQSFWPKGPPWWHTHHSAKMASSEEVSRKMLGHMDLCFLSPFNISWIIPVGGSVLVPRSFPGPPVVK